jgi:hypothetical protein
MTRGNGGRRMLLGFPIHEVSASLVRNPRPANTTSKYDLPLAQLIAFAFDVHIGVLLVTSESGTCADGYGYTDT